MLKLGIEWIFLAKVYLIFSLMSVVWDDLKQWIDVNERDFMSLCYTTNTILTDYHMYAPEMRLRIVPWKTLYQNSLLLLQKLSYFCTQLADWRGFRLDWKLSTIHLHKAIICTSKNSTEIRKERNVGVSLNIVSRN